jgi:isopentenyldiphosphate isomerase
MNGPTELWQLYNNQGSPILGKGALKEDVYGRALLHAASHVWIWRRTNNNSIEILLQKRATDKKTWPGRYDISAAGHIDIGEDPITAAIRETQEEIGFAINEQDLRFIGVDRRLMVAPDKSWTENELNWMYLLEIKQDVSFKLEDGEVDSLVWKSLAQIQKELADNTAKDSYVPHGSKYFGVVFGGIEQVEAES